VATIIANGALVQQRWVRRLVAGGVGPAARVVVGRAAVGEADLKVEVVLP
jgi:hypothetical protein